MPGAMPATPKQQMPMYAASLGPQPRPNTHFANTRLANTSLANTRSQYSLANTRLASTRLASTRLANTCLANTRLASTRLASTLFSHSSFLNLSVAHFGQWQFRSSPLLWQGSQCQPTTRIPDGGTPSIVVVQTIRPNIENENNPISNLASTQLEQSTII